MKFIIESKLANLRQDNMKTTSGLKRDRIEIITEILLFCNQYKAKTNIMYKTNLNYSQLQNHLAYLIASGMLANDGRKYLTTDKGYRFLELFAELQDLMSSQKI
jgi:predicted transcriptional regulator